MGIESWDWNMTGEKSTYHALYPRSWTVYDGIIFDLNVSNHVYYRLIYCKVLMYIKVMKMFLLDEQVNLTLNSE